MLKDRVHILRLREENRVAHPAIFLVLDHKSGSRCTLCVAAPLIKILRTTLKMGFFGHFFIYLAAKL